MNYSFWNLFKWLHWIFGCLISILEQTVIPKEIILVNAGGENIKKENSQKIDKKNIKLIYIAKNLNRVESLNIALNKSTSNIP